MGDEWGDTSPTSLIGIPLAFFLANEYLRACGLPGLTDESRIAGVYNNLDELADKFIGVAACELSLRDLASSITSRNTS